MSELECKVPEIVVPDDIISAVENELFASTSVETLSCLFWVSWVSLLFYKGAL